MNALEVGGLIILYFITSQGIAGFIEDQTTPDFDLGSGCTTADNSTTCQSISEGNFIDAVFDVTTSGFTDAPDWFNGIWVGIHAFLLTIAVILIVSYFVGLFFGGSS